MINYFRNLSSSSSVYGTHTLDAVLNEIRGSNPIMSGDIIRARDENNGGGKYNTDLNYKISVRNGNEWIDKPVNLYQHIKTTRIPAVTWGARFQGRRRRDCLEAFTGYMYFDVDQFEEISKDGVKEILTDNGFGFIKAVWDSFGGKGLGFLVKIDQTELKLNLKSFKSTFNSISNLLRHRGIIVDRATSDFTRTNVVSYDPEIFIREDSKVVGYKTVKPIERTEATKVEVNFDDKSVKYALDRIFNKFTNAEFVERGREEGGECGGVTHPFYFNFFVHTNLWGINPDLAVNYLISREYFHVSLLDNLNYKVKIFGHRSTEDVRLIASDVYSRYDDNNGRFHMKLDDGYEVEHVYKGYEGNVFAKLALLTHKQLQYNHEEYLVISGLVKKVRNAGIHLDDIFLSDGTDLFYHDLNISDDFKTNFKRAYKKSTSYFGYKSRLSIEGIQAKQADLINLNKSKGLNLNFIEGVENPEVYVVNLYNKVCKKMSPLESFGRLNNLTFKCIVNNVPKNVVLETVDAILKEEVSEDNLAKMLLVSPRHMVDQLINDIELTRQFANEVIDEVYDKNSWRLGYSFARFLSLEEVEDRYNVTKTYSVPHGKYLSDLGLTDLNRKIIWSSTGTGKTTWICDHMKTKRIILAPVTSMLTSIREKYDASVYFQDVKNVEEGDNLIVCTYSSFKSLYKQMLTWKDSRVCDYELYFDEHHNNAVGAEKGFRNPELNYVLTKISAFKSVTMLTGTMWSILHPVFENFEVIEVKWDVIPEKRFKMVNYRNLIHEVVSKLDKKNKNLIYLQNKQEDGKFGELIQYLLSQGYSREQIWTINSDTKKTPEFEFLAKHEKVKDECKVLICTSVAVEGINITNPDFTTVHFMSHESNILKEQFVNRLRSVYTQVKGVPNCMIYLYRSANYNGHQTDNFDSYEFQKILISKAKLLKALAPTQGESVTERLASRSVHSNMFSGSQGLINIDGKWEIDYLEIAYQAYKTEKDYAYSDLDFTTRMMKAYNWVYIGEEESSGDMKQTDKDKLREFAQVRLEEKLLEANEYLETVISEGEDNLVASLDEENLPNLENHDIDIRTKVRSLCNYMSFKNATNIVDYWINDTEESKNAWKRIRRQVLIKALDVLELNKKGKDLSDALSQSLIKTFKSIKKKEVKKGFAEYLSEKEILNMVKNKMRKINKYNAIYKDIGFKMAIEILDKIFHLRLVMIGGVQKYYIEGIKIHNDLVTFNKRFEDFLQKSFSNNSVVEFTNVEFANILNSFRKDLPLLCVHTLDGKQAMRILKDYVTIENGSKRLDSKTNRRVQYYKITSMFPEDIKDVKIEPLRNVSFHDRHTNDWSIAEQKAYNAKINNEVNLLLYQVKGSESDKFKQNKKTLAY